MKRFLFIPLSLVLFSMTTVKKTRIVFFGDSITQMGINKGGYIDRIQNTLNDKGIQKKYELIGKGVGGNKVYDLYLRMEEDVLAKKPSVVLIYVGINDVWHKTSGIGTDIEKYEKFYAAIIKKLQAKKIKVIVCTPTVIGEKKNNANPQDDDLDRYSDVIRRLATTYSCTLVDLNAAFANYEERNNPDNKESGILTTDRVHLNDKGNQLVADEVMKALSIN
ncbi:MAG: SGNH/GDSL hydrolase family protein [Ferruginibacter sp.]|nr:SGNH/GDSL hydrolase family protein [Chitinophagaceae bacterium]